MDRLAIIESYSKKYKYLSFNKYNFISCLGDFGHTDSYVIDSWQHYI